MSDEPLTPFGEEQVNRLLLEMYRADPASWRVDDHGHRYYVGPVWAGDGTINYREPES